LDAGTVLDLDSDLLMAALGVAFTAVLEGAVLVAGLASGLAMDFFATGTGFLDFWAGM
jgi:hypothetical protein